MQSTRVHFSVSKFTNPLYNQQILLFKRIYKHKIVRSMNSDLCDLYQSDTHAQSEAKQEKGI